MADKRVLGLEAVAATALPLAWGDDTTTKASRRRNAVTARRSQDNRRADDGSIMEGAFSCCDRTIEARATIDRMRWFLLDGRFFFLEICFHRHVLVGPFRDVTMNL
jgi:hypothetical protein